MNTFLKTADKDTIKTFILGATLLLSVLATAVIAQTTPPGYDRPAAEAPGNNKSLEHFVVDTQVYTDAYSADAMQTKKDSKDSKPPRFARRRHAK